MKSCNAHGEFDFLDAYRVRVVAYPHHKPETISSKSPELNIAPAPCQLAAVSWAIGACCGPSGALTKPLQFQRCLPCTTVTCVWRDVCGWQRCWRESSSPARFHPASSLRPEKKMYAIPLCSRQLLKTAAQVLTLLPSQ